jgi:NAD(P)-dependent dehydrogenase (short-subunit alcohol dehydrogenase family)
MAKIWALDQVPPQTKRVAVITGGNAGLGFETAVQLASKDFIVVLTCRSPVRAEQALQRMLAINSEAKVVTAIIDTGCLQSVRDFAEQFIEQYTRCDLLINNAGIMMPPYQLSVDGFESQLACNYLGHFLLTGLLLPMLTKTAGSRVVTLSSLAHRWGAIQFDDINFSRRYDRKQAYGQSKAACLMFAFELQNRFREAGINCLSIAAHPGVSHTQLGRNLPLPLRLFIPLLAPIFTQPVEAGAMPILYAALNEQLIGGEYTGPASSNGHRGPPAVVDCEPWARDRQLAERLWQLSEQMVGFNYDFKT